MAKSKRLDESNKQKLRRAFKEVTGREFEEVVPERDKRKTYLLKFRDLLRCGKHSPDTAISLFKKFIIDFRVAKKTVQGMYLLKYNIRIENDVDTEDRIEMYEFYINHGLEMTIQKYFN